MQLYTDTIGIIMPTLLIEALKPIVHVSLSLVEVELFSRVQSFSKLFTQILTNNICAVKTQKDVKGVRFKCIPTAMGEVFRRDKSTISRHIKNVFVGENC